MELNATTWKPWHDELMKMVVDGVSPVQMSLRLNKSSKMIKDVVGSEYFKVRMSDIQQTITTSITKTWLEAIDTDAVKEAREEIGRSAVEAAKTIVWISKNGEVEDKMRFEAAKDILDRAGVRAPELVKQQREERSYSPEEVAKAREILAESEAIVKRLINTPNRFVIADGK